MTPAPAMAADTGPFSLAFRGARREDPTMDRAELERFDRDALIRRAEEAGVARPSILTRPELVDELLLRGTPGVDDGERRADPALKRLRGFFGIARDLLASVVDRGLHLPDAAERIRALRVPAQEPASTKRPPAVLPTVTLAEIYAAQGHRERAIETLERVLEREPDHAAAEALLGQLKDAAFRVPEPTIAPETDEETSRDVSEAGGGGAVGEPSGAPADACVALPVDGASLFVSWELSGPSLARARRLAGDHPQGLTLSFVFAVPSWEGPVVSTHEVGVDLAAAGRWSGGIPSGAVARVALGVRGAEGFVPLMHSAALEIAGAGSGGVATSTNGAASNGHLDTVGRLRRWTPSGWTSLKPSDPDAGAIARALAHPAVAARLAASTGRPGFGTQST
jgi:hypothetical protein